MKKPQPDIVEPKQTIRVESIEPLKQTPIPQQDQRVVVQQKAPIPAPVAAPSAEQSLQLYLQTKKQLEEEEKRHGFTKERLAQIEVKLSGVEESQKAAVKELNEFVNELAEKLIEYDHSLTLESNRTKDNIRKAIVELMSLRLQFEAAKIENDKYLDQIKADRAEIEIEKGRITNQLNTVIDDFKVWREKIKVYNERVVVQKKNGHWYNSFLSRFGN